MLAGKHLQRLALLPGALCQLCPAAQARSTFTLTCSGFCKHRVSLNGSEQAAMNSEDLERDLTSWPKAGTRQRQRGL